MKAPRKRHLPRAWHAAASYVVPVTLLVVWEAVVRLGWINPFLLPAPSAFGARWIDEVASGFILRDALLTMTRALSGFLIAAAAGIAIGTLAARNAAARWFVDPVVSVGFPMPKISFMPIFMLWFGLGDQAKLAMIVFTCIFPVISATYLGTRSIDRYLVWSAQNLGTSQRALLWKVVIPAALPQILSGLQIAFPMALIVTVVTEMITSGGGLGSYMIVSARAAISEKVFAGIATIAVLGFLLLLAFDQLRRRLLRWHAETMVTI